MASSNHFHSAESAEVVSFFKSELQKGLSGSEAAARLEKYGSNSIKENKKRSSFSIFFSQFKSPIVIILLFAAAVSFWFKEWLDASAVLFVIVVNALIGFYMEYKAELSMAALMKMSTATARVLRSGKLREVDSGTLVPGDIVFVESGDLVPADGRVFSLSQLQANESALTGESIPVNKQTDALPESSPLAERYNMLYKGTFITKGNGYMIVTATGMETEVGKISTLVLSETEEATPLEKKLEAFTRKLIRITLVLVFVMVAAGLLYGQTIYEMFETAVALAVAAIPEGLPIVATMALAHGMIKMARKNVIVKKLSAVETLGGTNVICTDKTGTLTKNQIEVSGVFPSSPKAGEIIDKISILCNTAEIHFVNEKLEELGDPLETGLLKYWYSKEVDIAKMRKDNPKIGEEPFSSETKIMATLHKTGSGLTSYVKGAAEEVLSLCNRILDESGEKQLDKEGKESWLLKAEEFASSGLRVIAVAFKPVASEEEGISSELIFAGLVTMMDPPRKEVFPAIRECHSAGINIIMVTGDHPATAKNIASDLGIVHDKDANVINGKNMKAFGDLTPQEKELWEKTSVFARVSPGQKLDLISVLQEKGYVVAMTGDGINDAPALKKADIGIAMGKRGTQVAQEVSDMILKDDSFSSIVLAIRQGRIIFENIRKFITFLISCNLSELLVISTAAVFNLHFQLFPLQILFINLITDVLPALALGMTAGSPRIMNMPPRKVSEPIIDKRRWKSIAFYSIVISVASVGAVMFSHFVFHGSEPWNTQLCNNILFFTLIFSQLLHVLNMGNSGWSVFKSEVFRNKYVWYAITFSTGIVLGIYFTPVGKILNIHKLTAQDWTLIVTSSILSFIIIYLAKAFKFIHK